MMVIISGTPEFQLAPELLEWFGAVFKESYARILKYCLKRCESKAQAEDVCQEVFVRALKNASKLREHENLAAWLHTTARHVTSEEWRRQRRLNRALMLLVFVEERCDHVQEHEDKRMQEARLMRLEIAIACLKPSQQIIIRWSLDGVPYKEMASRLGITDNAVGTRLHRAKLALKKASGSIDVGALSTAEEIHELGSRRK